MRWKQDAVRTRVDSGISVVERYRNKAQEYRSAAESASPPGRREALMRIAENLERLAEAYEAYERSRSRRQHFAER